MISDTEKEINANRLDAMNEESAENEEDPMSNLYNKYKGAKSNWFYHFDRASYRL